MKSFLNWFEITGKENWLVRCPYIRIIHKRLFPEHPDYNGGDY